MCSSDLAAVAEEDDELPEDRFSELEARLARVEEQLASLLESLGRSAPPDELAVDADEEAAIEHAASSRFDEPA